MSEKREYIVVVKPGEDLTALDSEMSATAGSGVIPQRAVECADPQEHDTRMTHWMLTDEEAKSLETDSRILAVEKPYDDRPELVRVKYAWQPGTFNKTSANDGVNWGLSRCNSIVNNFDGASSIFDNYKYCMTGEGVDVVIMDSGIELDHPEFKDAAGAARIQAIDWYAASNGAMSGTQGAGFYTDTDGHGTHCAGIAAGKTYGWAKNAHIYSVKIFDTDMVSDTVAMDLIRHWHTNKGNNRPTIVNMSYGYQVQPDGWPGVGVASGDHGQCWNPFTNTMDVWNFGQAGYVNNVECSHQTDLSWGTSGWSHRVANVDAKLDQLIAAGVHVTIAAGNMYDVQYNYTDDANDNYNDFISRPSFSSGQHFYYHRGSSPRASTVKGGEMVVGNIGVEEHNNKEKLSASSASGEALDIHAPGSNITSSCSTDTSDAAGGSRSVSDYPDDPNFKIISMTGTSMAAPQVCGLGALYLQSEPTLSPAGLKKKMQDDAKVGLLYDDLSWDQKASNRYDQVHDQDGVPEHNGLHGAPNKVLYNNFAGDVFVRWVKATP
jgi:subtilisin family serine protease